MNTLLRRLLTVANRYPQQVAVEWDDGKLTYAELWSLARDIGASLVEAVGEASPGVVAVTAHRSATTIATYLTCLSRGWVYVPVPVGAPDERVNQVLTLSGAQSLLEPHGQDLAWDVRQLTPTAEVQPRYRADDVSVPDTEADNDLACLLHTSGSTGTPKGVQITAGNLDAFVRWCLEDLPLTPDDRVASLSPFHFDLATHDIYATLSSGATLVLPDADVEASPHHALAFVTGRAITRLYMVPTFLERLSRAGAKRNVNALAVTTVLFAGERLRSTARPLVEQVFPAAQLWNLYGPIETNVVTAARLLRGREHDSSDLGHALPGVTLAVQDTDGRVLPAGHGELLAAGPSVTPGYVGHLTTPFVPHDGTRYYATGDEVDLDDDGRVTLRGRIDNMVKIRGLRVELEEVEAVIGLAPGVEAVGVTMSADGLGLVAHVQTESKDDIAAARRNCTSRLPDYMVPGSWHRIDDIPTTASGKVDRQELLRSLTTEQVGR